MPSSGFTDIVSRDDTGPSVSTEEHRPEPGPRPLSEAERAAAFRRPEPKIPPKFALIVVAVLVVLGVGGTLLDHLLSSVGLNPDASSAGQATATTASVGCHRSPGFASVDAAGGRCPTAVHGDHPTLGRRRGVLARGPGRASRRRSPRSAAAPWS